MIRSPIISVLGHVDHGKSSILDSIRDSNILITEAGAITQSIGASIIPLESLKQKAGLMLQKFGIEVKIPGLLVIDTPGHAAFTSLRKRGGNLADIAILTIDINEGFKPQTIEALEILKASKTPFVIAANKIDLIPQYRKHSNSFMEDLNKQTPEFQRLIEEKLYKLVGTLYDKFSIQAERFDRADFAKQVAIVPISAKQNVGIPELLTIILGLAQKFLSNDLEINPDAQAKGIILEVKEEKGLGITLDAIIYDGSLKKNDLVIIGGLDGPIVTKVRALLQPAPLKEMRDKKTPFISVNKVVAATGVKLSCPDVGEVFGGMPLIGNPQDLEAAKEEVQKEVSEVILDTDNEGIVVKADSLGSLEALLGMLHQEGIKVKKARVGKISKKDFADAEANHEKNPFYSTIVGFNIPSVEPTDKVKVITAEIIYRIIDDLKLYKEEMAKENKKLELKGLILPAKFQVLSGCVFRQRNPCVVGVEILQGTLTTNSNIMKDGKIIGRIKTIQEKNESKQKARYREQVAISIPEATAGRQIEEEDICYSAPNEIEFRKLKELKDILEGDEKTALKEIAEVMRRGNPVWGL